MFYFLFFFIVIISYPVLMKMKNGNKIYCIFTGICYFAVAALRSNTIGFDTAIYVNAFEKLSKMPLDAVITFSDKDVCFWILLALLGKITSNYTILFFFISGIFTISAWYFIYKYSKDPRLSIVVMLAFNLYQFTLTGMRQTLAMSFILWSINYCYQKKIIKSIIFILIGAIFHNSALIFIVVILFRTYKKHLTHMYAVGIACLLGLVFLLRETIAERLIVFIQDRGYELTMLNGGLTMTFVIFVLFLLACLFIREYNFSDENATLTYLIAMTACFFEMLVSTQSIFFRIAFYFLIIYIVFVPNVIESIRDGKSRFIIKISIYILLTIQYLAFTIGSCGILPYQTFWQV